MKNSISIMIINGNEINCLLISEIVKSCGHIPVIAKTVEEAENEIDTTPPFLIILEYSLFKAKQFLQLIESKYNKIKLILTTTSKEDLESDAFSKNYQIFLMPIKNELWISTIQNAVYEMA